MIQDASSTVAVSRTVSWRRVTFGVEGAFGLEVFEAHVEDSV